MPNSLPYDGVNANRLIMKSFVMTRDSIPALVAVAIWLAIVGCEIWFHAASATEPPVWDALSYSMKSKGFWDAIGAGHAFNPFSIEPSVRPPGVVLVSYPFGFSESFAGFYFRTNFVPALLLALSVLVVGWANQAVRNSPLVVAGMSICIAGLPTVFQFQVAFEEISSAGFWGLVDNFITAVAALAAASLVAAAMLRSWKWVALAAGLAGFCLWIKPAGLLVMACMFSAWACLAGREIARDRKLGSWILKSLFAFVLAYAVAGGAAFLSPYFSHANAELGSRAVEILQSEYPWSFNLSVVAERLHVGTGWGVAATIVLGLAAAAVRREQRWTVLAAAVTLASGAWFWLLFADVMQVRYFLPFALMAAVFLLPSVIDSISRRPAFAQGVLVVTLCLPALASTAAATMSRPSKDVQRVLGVNLTSNAFAAEGRLASDVLEDAKRREIRTPRIYVCSNSGPLRSFSAAIEYSRVIGKAGTKGAVSVPFDWSRGSAFRLDEILSADYIACDHAERMGRSMRGCRTAGQDMLVGCEIDSSGRTENGPRREDVLSFADEQRVVRDWLSVLGSESGVEVIARGSVNLIRVASRGTFELAVSDFASRFNWRQIASDGYTARWWTEEDLAAESGRSPVGALGIPFRDESGRLLQSVKGLRVLTRGRDAIVDVWLQPGPDESLVATEGFRLFCHLETTDGSIVAHSEAPVSQITRSGHLRQYRLVLANAVRPDARKFALGMYGPGKPRAAEAVLLRSESPGMEWDGRRFPFPAGPFPTSSAVFGQSPAARDLK